MPVSGSGVSGVSFMLRRGGRGTTRGIAGLRIGCRVLVLRCGTRTWHFRLRKSGTIVGPV